MDQFKKDILFGILVFIVALVLTQNIVWSFGAGLLTGLLINRSAKTKPRQKFKKFDSEKGGYTNQRGTNRTRTKRTVSFQEREHQNIRAK